MNKKGFTLVELLAVVAILAILVIIALPNVVKMYNQAKRNVFETEIKNIYKAAQSEWMSSSFFNPGEKIYSRIDGKACGKGLKLSGNDKTDYIIQINSQGAVTYFRAGDKRYQYGYSGDGLKLADIGRESTDDNKFGEIYDIKNRKVYKFSCVAGSPFSGSTFADNLYDETSYGDVAVADKGDVINVKIKRLANPNETGITANSADTNITAILRSTTPPSEENKGELNTISTSSSVKPAYAWYDNGKIYWWTESGTLTLNKDSAHFFFNLNNLTDISSLQYFDISKVQNLFAFFSYNSKLTNLSSISNWNVSNVKKFTHMFSYCSSLTDISALSNWNTSSAESIGYMFWNTSLLSNFNAVSNFNTSNVTEMSGTFGMGPGISKTNNVIIDFSALSNWNTSKVNNMYIMFQNVNIASYIPFRNWDVSKVESFYSTFNATSYSTVTTLEGLENWDVSSVTNMDSMFFQNVKLEDARAISNWDIHNVTNVYGMFSSCKKLKYLDIGNFDMSKVENTGEFITSQVLEQFKTPKAYPTDSNITITLPKQMHDSDNNTYTTLNNSSPTQTWLYN